MRGQENVAKRPYSAQTGWSLARHVSECQFRKGFHSVFLTVSAPLLEVARYRAYAPRKGGF
jgi:hypothetical protein